MSTTYGDLLNPDREIIWQNGIKSDKTHHKITHNPSSISPGDTLQITIPQLKKNDVIVPNTLELTFDFTVTDQFIQNLSAGLIEQMVIKLGGNSLQTINKHNLYNIYRQLWKYKRVDMYRQGIQSDNILKIRHNLPTKDETIAEDKAVADCYKTRYSIPLDFPLHETAMSPQTLGDEIQIDLRFAQGSEICKTGTYAISKVCLEYDSLNHSGITSALEYKMSNHQLMYQGVHHYKSYNIDELNTTFDIDISVTKKSVRNVVILFKDANTYDKLETFVNPQVKSIRVDIDGSSNQLYASGLEPHHLWPNAQNLFSCGDTDMTLAKFYNNRHSIVIDLQTTPDKMLEGIGRDVKNSIQIKIEKDVTAKDLVAYVFLIYDITANIMEGRYTTSHM
jgi:hypothetical protein